MGISAEMVDEKRGYSNSDGPLPPFLLFISKKFHFASLRYTIELQW